MGYIITIFSGFMCRVSTMQKWAAYVTMTCWTRWGLQVCHLLSAVVTSCINTFIRCVPPKSRSNTNTPT